MVLWWWTRPSTYAALCRVQGEGEASMPVKGGLRNSRIGQACTTWRAYKHQHLLIMLLALSIHNISTRSSRTTYHSGSLILLGGGLLRKTANKQIYIQEWTDSSTFQSQRITSPFCSVTMFHDTVWYHLPWSTALKSLGPKGEEQEPLASAWRSKRKAWGDTAVTIPLNTNTNVCMFINHYRRYNQVSYVFCYSKPFFPTGS